LNKIQFDSITFQEQNEICGMEPERSGWNLTEKSGTERDLKWDENYSILFLFWIDMECFGHSRRNGMELTTLIETYTWYGDLWRKFHILIKPTLF